MSPAKAADELHLDAWVVDALERDDYGRVGPAVYVKGHLRRYAEILGLPAVEIVAAYEAPPPAAPPPPVAGMRMRAAAPTGSELPWVPVAGLALAAALIVGLVWWRPWHPRTINARLVPTPAVGAASNTGEVAHKVATVSDEAAHGVTPAPGSERGVAGAAAFSVPGAVPALRSTDAPAVPGAVPVLRSTDAPAPSTVVAGVAFRPARPAAGPRGDGDATAGAGRARLRLRFSADSWVDVRDAAGQHVFAGNGRANTVRTMAGSAPLRVYLRAANGVQLEINNHAVAIGPQYVVGNVAHFEAGADGVLRRDTGHGPRPRG